MNILIYIPAMDQSFGGLRQYTATLLRLLGQDTKNHYLIYHDVSDPEIMNAASKIARHQIVKTREINLAYRRLPAYVAKFSNLLYRLVRSSKRVTIPNNFALFCTLNDISIVHCPYQYLPPQSTARMITTLHDVQELHFPAFFTPEERAYRASTYLDILKRADAVIVSYRHVKEDLVKYFNVEESRINTVLLQMNNLWFERFIGKEPIPLPSNVPFSKYVLYPANTWQHKNHAALLRAVEYLKKELGVVVNVVCTGHITTPYGQHLAQLVIELGLQEQVVFLGVVDETCLYSLYKHAVGAVIPTLYEAGSFPLMESIFLEIPVICSNVTSLPETIGDAAYLFDPNDVPSLVEKLQLLWQDEQYRHRSIENTNQRKDRLINTGAFANLMGIYELIHKKS